MKTGLVIASLLIVQPCIGLAQDCCAADSSFREIEFPLTEKDTETVFFYFNNEWIAGADPGMVSPGEIAGMEVKEDVHGNRAMFLTVSAETLAKLKSMVDEAGKGEYLSYDPICEFPGGWGELKEWLDRNIRIPEGYKGYERVMVRFFVMPDGSVAEPVVLKPSRNEAANAEALRLVRAMPGFRVRYRTPERKPVGIALPISFREPGLVLIRGDASFPDGR